MRSPRGRSRPRGKKYWPIVFEMRLRGADFRDRAEQEVLAVQALPDWRTHDFFITCREPPMDDERVADVLVGAGRFGRGIICFHVRAKGL